jgi:transcriptional regulator with XRE-family HTH domain
MDSIRLFVILHGTMEVDSKMAVSLQHWRQRNALTQVNAAALLGVSQPYLSLLEKGARPLTATIRSRMKNVRQTDRPASDDRFRRQLSALGYPKFAHVTPARPKSSPDSLLVSVLGVPNVDARVVEALPWLVRRYADQLDLDWLVRQAKLQNLQNRLGFVLQTAGIETPKLVAAVRELERARLLQEATLCWDSMPAATREWMRVHRAPSAEHWNILTKLQTEDVDSAA